MFKVFVLLFVSVVNINAQDTIVLHAHQSLGDTVDIIERNRFRLFPEYYGTFKYAQYIGIGDKTFLKIRTGSGSIEFLQYTTQDILNDNEKVTSNFFQNTTVKQNAGVGKKIRLVFYEPGRNRKIKLKEGKKFSFSTEKSESSSYYLGADFKKRKENYLKDAKLLKILDTGESSLKVKLMDYGGTIEVIPISMIMKVSNYRTARIKRLWGIVIGTFGGTILLGTIGSDDPSPGILIGTPILVYGVYKTFTLNTTIDLSRNGQSLIYRK